LILKILTLYQLWMFQSTLEYQYIDQLCFAEDYISTIFSMIILNNHRFTYPCACLAICLAAFVHRLIIGK
jgi:hypothetical protein